MNANNLCNTETRRSFCRYIKFIVLQTRKRRVSINSTTIYIQLSGDSGTWLPVIDSHTQKLLVNIATSYVRIPYTTLMCSCSELTCDRGKHELSATQIKINEMKTTPTVDVDSHVSGTTLPNREVKNTDQSATVWLHSDFYNILIVRLFQCTFSTHNQILEDHIL